jgi:hypothetical protein
MAQDFLKIRTGVTLKPNAAPASPESGDFYYDSGTNQFNFYQNGVWSTLSGTTAAPLWAKYTTTFSTLSTGSTTNSVTLFSLPAKAMIHQVIIKHSAAFSGGAISAYTIAVGDAGNSNRFTTPFDAFQAAGDTTRSITQADDIASFASPTNILLTATSTGANLSAATTGSVDVWVLTSTLP